MGLGNIKQDLTQGVKNIWGWKTDRKIVVLSIDDYGNVRVGSPEARNNMDKAGLKISSHFDVYDTLETNDDLHALFDTLRSVKDKNGRHAVFTPFAMPANIDFEKVIESGFNEFHYELLPVTFSKLKGYEAVQQTIQQGIAEGIFLPQFHGREHLNLKVFKENLLSRHADTLEALRNRSYARISGKKYPTISYTAAFDFYRFEENHAFDDVIQEGLNAFEKVFGYRAQHFNSPGGREHRYIHSALARAGIKYIDTPWLKQEHQGMGKYKRVFNYTGKKNRLGQLFVVRNCVFEPTVNTKDAVGLCMKQVEYAFKFNRPANISSHRVNFCGYIDEANRQKGLGDLQLLLKKLIARWPDIEFMAANEAAALMQPAR